jgi:hypothetical protein
MLLSSQRGTSKSLKTHERCIECVHIQLYQNRGEMETKYSTCFDCHTNEICHLFPLKQI